MNATAYSSHLMTAVEAVQAIIDQALNSSASDIHCEPEEDCLRIRYRIDGVLHTVALADISLASQIISRVKVLAYIDVSEKRVPQDGKCSFAHKSTFVDLRVATFPTVYGEKVVIRILDKSPTLLSLDNLGLTPDIIQKVRNFTSRAQGFFLLTGPTGSGKTTTLYALLTELLSLNKNIVTLEDPIEYTLKGISQSQIAPETGFTFAKGLRSLLRQDPDIIMIGEIRDTETASIALQAALTGHLVLSTLHTADAISVLFRLIDMGVQPFLLNAALGGIIAQRLARKLCDNCKKSVKLTSADKEFIAHYELDIRESFLSTGCLECHNLGYKGRIGIFEFLLLSPELQLTFKRYPEKDILYRQAHLEGMKTLLFDGAIKVNNGTIALSELHALLI